MCTTSSSPAGQAPKCYRPWKGEDEVVHIRHEQTKQPGGQNEPRAFILPMILRDEINIFKGGGVVSVSSSLLILNIIFSEGQN